MVSRKNNGNIKEVSIRSKLIILFVDYAIFGLLLIFVDIFYSNLGFVKNCPWLSILLIYFMFFTLSELFFNRTLGMKLFKVLIINKKQGILNRAFAIYSFLIILDRFLFLLIIYFFRVFFHSKKNLLLSEKYSGIRWSKE